MTAVASSFSNQFMRKVPYDTLKDFTPIMQYAEYTFGLVVMADSPWKTFKDFIDYAKANPGKIRFSSTGPADTQSLVMTMIAKHHQIKWTHIPFEGGPPALMALLGGHVEAYSTTMHCKSHIQAGRLRLLASYGEKRIPSFPDVPTLLELGFPFVPSSPMIILGPKGLSSEVVETVHQAFKKAMEDPDFIKACGLMDHLIIYRNPQETLKKMHQVKEIYWGLISELKQPRKE